MTTWTAADQAELALLVHELCRGAFSHRERCPRCRDGGRSCESVGEAIDVVLEWRDWRGLRTRAAALRAEQNLIEATDRKEVA